MMLTFMATLTISSTATWRADADEGMWLFTNPPTKYLKENYGFVPTKEWLEHVQRSCVRIRAGGSASFVSPNGLVMTNHHVGADALHKLSTKEKDYLRDGFYARTPAEELKCVDQEFHVLMSIEDVTDRVNRAVKPDMSPADAEKARRAVINTIEKESKEKTGLHSEVVTLYQGGQYHLYRYKRYTDVRLVFAPEQAAAFFGGDPDNFEYPRYCLDICFFRVYENGKPAKVKDYLKWSPNGCKDGELTFVAGHPGRTDRLNTVNHLEFIRDVDLPNRLNLIRRREVLLSVYSSRSAENARRAKDELFMYQNSRKARLGMLAGLQDPKLMNRKRQQEEALKEAVQKDERLRTAYGDAWDQVAEAIRTYRQIYMRHYLLERGAAFNSQLFSKARQLVRLAEETSKPNAERLREYADARLDSLKQSLFSPAPIYEDLETLKLADSLSMLMEIAGADNAFVQRILGGKSPRQRAAELIQGTRLRDVTFRKKLADGGQRAIEACDDPMILLARRVDPPSRAVRRRYEQQVREPLRQAYGKIAQARFAVYGADLYPDATFTLRLAFGPVKGYREDGHRVAPFTTIGGLYRRAQLHGYKYPFNPPQRWLERKDRINLDTPFNFVNTADIIGGNSGSPVINRNGEVVGIIFDGNIYSLVLDYAYTDELARAISVDSRAIIEALKNVYDADALVQELTGSN